VNCTGRIKARHCSHLEAKSERAASGRAVIGPAKATQRTTGAPALIDSCRCFCCFVLYLYSIFLLCCIFAHVFIVIDFHLRFA
jgi:hypothetical protein